MKLLRVVALLFVPFAAARPRLGTETHSMGPVLDEKTFQQAELAIAVRSVPANGLRPKKR